jgi:hypothetical protein
MFIVIWVNPRPEQRGARRAGEAGRPKAAVRGRRLLADVVWTAFLQASTRNVCTRKFGVSFVARADARGAATDCSQSRGHSSGCCNGNPRLPSRAKSLRFVKASCVRFGDAIYHLLAQAGEHLVSKRDRCGLPMQEKLGGRLVPRVEKRHGHVKNLGESTRDFVARDVFAGLVLADTRTGRELVDPSPGRQLFLRNGQALTGLPQAYAEHR